MLDAGEGDSDRTMMAASPLVNERRGDRRRPPKRDSVTRLDAFLPRPAATIEPELDAIESIELEAVALEPESAPILVDDNDSIALADLEDIEDVEDDALEGVSPLEHQRARRPGAVAHRNAARSRRGAGVARDDGRHPGRIGGGAGVEAATELARRQPYANPPAAGCGRGGACARPPR